MVKSPGFRLQMSFGPSLRASEAQRQRLRAHGPGRRAAQLVAARAQHAAAEVLASKIHGSIWEKLELRIVS